MKTNQGTILITAGLLVMSTSLIVTHYVPLPDFISGIMFGVGIGLMLLSFFKTKKTNVKG